jgi:glycosyltransferase involved in cell wall biosynthesis
VRIAVIASPVTPLRPVQAGGAQAILTDIAIGLTRRGHEVRLFCAEGSTVPGVELVMVPQPSDAAAALVMPAGKPPPPAPGVKAAFEAMFEAVIASEADVVSQHAFDAPAFDLAKDLPVLHTLHLPPLVPAVVEAAARVPAARLVTVSESCRQAWERAGVAIGRVLRNGVSEIQVGSPRVDNVALVAGRLSPEKGIEHAIKAAKAVGLPVRIAGALYDPAFEIDLTGAEVMGALTREDLRHVMAASAVTVCAVRWDEPFGMVAAEAQMAGCPVAAYRRGALPEVVEEGVGGVLADPDDVDMLAGAILECLTLDRAAVRSSARANLGLEDALDRYEVALAGAAR